MIFNSVFKCDGYEDVYEAVAKHFEAHNIKAEIPKDAKVLIKPNLVADKDAVFSITTNPVFVYAIIKYLNETGIKNITVADCPGGALLLFSDMADVFERCGYGFLKDFAQLNCNFESEDVFCAENFTEKKFNIIKAVTDADYIINVPKLKTHNLTCITAGVKNLFGCIPGLKKPEFHAKYPQIKDFSNMLVELAATVKPDFTIVDAVDIMEGNGPTNGKKRHLGLTFASKDVFGLDKFIAEFLEIPAELAGTLKAAEKKGFGKIDSEPVGDLDFKLSQPIMLPGYIESKTVGGKINARFKTLIEKTADKIIKRYPVMNDKCICCGKCVKTCPKQALSVSSGKIILDVQKCIGCFCCDECCTRGAVDIGKKLDVHKRR